MKCSEIVLGPLIALYEIWNLHFSDSLVEPMQEKTEVSKVVALTLHQRQ